MTRTYLDARTWTVIIPANRNEKVAVFCLKNTEPLDVVAAEFLDCECVEPVNAAGLRLLGLQLLADEHPHERARNLRASWLSPTWGILGDALVVTTTATDNGPDLAWLTKDEARDLMNRLDRFVLTRVAA